MSVSALALNGIDKSFDGRAALNAASMHVKWGELHALLGENGAGKSTLMNIVCGLYTADDGATAINGRVVQITGPSDATRHGIGMVHQHFKLVGSFTVAENVWLACKNTSGIHSIHDAATRTTEAASNLGFKINPQSRTDQLSVAEQQRIEIVKLILLGADILILDEPTAVLTDDESENVLTLLKSMVAQGKTVILITHRLREVVGFADRVTVMRNGKTVLDGEDTSSLDETRLAQAMVGEPLRSVQRQIAGEGPQSGQPRLALNRICVTRDDGTRALADVSLQIRSGEILGIAGVGGNGQTELVEAIYGLMPIASGDIHIDGEGLAKLSIAQRRHRGLRLVPADRFDYSLLADFKAYENLAITEVPANRFGSVWRLARREMRDAAQIHFTTHGIIGGTPTTRTRLLSGGNAQKLLLARELNATTSVLVAHSPTRGLDVRAYRTVHEAIITSVDRGAACLLISEDLDEVLTLSTQVAVITRGKLHGPFAIEDTNRARLGELMAGHA